MSSGKRAKPVRNFVAESDGFGTLTEKLKAAEAALTERVWKTREQKKKAAGESAVLVFELDLTSEDYEFLGGLLARALPGELEHPDRLENLFDASPLVFITSLVGHALTHGSSSFWDSYWQRLGVRDGSVLYELLRKKLHPALSRKKLTTFTSADLAQRDYVGTLELHAGLRGLDLPAVVALIASAQTNGIAFKDAEEFGTWAVTEFSSSQLGHSHPTALTNLAIHLPQRARDLMSRIYELCEYSHSLGGWSEADEFEGTHGLPEPTFQKLIRFLSGETDDAETADVIEDPGTVDISLPPPSLHFDFDTLEFRLIFPAVAQEGWPSAEPPRWTVNIDGSTTSVSPRPDWTRGGLEETSLKLTSPFARIKATTPDGTDVPVRGGFDDTQPILFLRANGQVHKNQKNLRGREVYAVMPANTKLKARTGDENTVNYQDLGPLPGWPNWIARRISLIDVSSLTLRGEEFSKRWAVVADKSASWSAEDCVINYLRGTDLQPVYHSSPTVIIPDDDSTWELQYTHLTLDGDHYDLGSYVVEDELRGIPLRLFDEQDDPWVGRFQVEVFKDGKKKESWTFNLAEGLRIRLTYDTSHRSQFRVPVKDAHGARLSKAYAYFESDVGARLHHPTEVQDLGPQSRSEVLIIKSRVEPDIYSLNVEVSAPRLQFRLPQVDEQSVWSEDIDKVTFDDLAETDTFQVRFPQRVYDVGLLITAGTSHSSPHEVTLSRQGKSNVWTVSMSRIKAVMAVERDYDVGVLWFTSTADDYAKKRLSGGARKDYFTTPQSQRRDPRTPAGAVLFSVSKAPLLVGAHVKDKKITLELGREASQPLVAWVWSVADPFHPPLKLEVLGRNAPVPSEFLNIGPLIVEAREKTLLMMWEPETPSARAVVADQPGLSPELDPVNPRRWLFTRSSETRLVGQEIRTAWEARDVLHHVLADPRNREHRTIARFDDTTRHYLLDNPRISLSELDKTNIPQVRQLEAFIRSGLVLENFQSAHTAGDIHPVPWIGLIQEMNDYRVLTGPRKDEPFIAAELAHSEHYLHTVGGPDLWKSFSTGGHGARLVEKTFFSAEDLKRVNSPDYLQLHREPDSTSAEVSIISEDARIQAQVEWVKNKRDLSNLSTLPEFFGSLSSWEYLIDESGDPELKKTTRSLSYLPERLVKDQNDYWLYVPYVSLVSSLLARMVAHKHLRPIKDLEEFRDTWAACAAAVPSLAAFDIILAESIALKSTTSVS